MIEPISALRDRATRATLPGQDAIWPSVFERYIESMNAKDLAGVIGLYHDGSPYRELEKQRLAHLFSNLDCTGELLAVRHVGQDGEFVLVCVRQKGTNPAAPPELRSRIESSIVALRRDGDAWKIWAMMPLEASAA